jgi:hypothetical protein
MLVMASGVQTPPREEDAPPSRLDERVAAAISPPLRRSVGRLRETGSTTPGRLRLVSIAIVVVLVVTWAIAFTSATRRANNVNGIRGQTEPVVVAMQRVHAALSQADASAANSFLAGGIEPVSERARYLDGTTTATKELAGASGHIETSKSAQKNFQTITQWLPVYTGFVEQARANNRVRNTEVGSAYLRYASRIMQQQILPATNRLYNLNAARLDSQYVHATYWSDVLLVLVVGALALSVLVATQVFVFRRTNRVLNVPLVVATAFVVIALVWALVAFVGQRSHMVDARDQGYRPLTLLTQTRTLAYQARGDTNLSLIARGSGAFDSDYESAVRQMGFKACAPATGTSCDSGQLQHTGTMVTALQVTPSTSLGDVKRASSNLAGYLVLNQHIRSLGAAGQINAAVGLALATGPGTANSAFTRFDHSITTATTATRSQFEQLIDTAHNWLGGLPLGLTLLLVLAGVLALVGLQLRINEYQ